MEHSLDPSLLLGDDANAEVHSWILHRDQVIARMVALAVRADGLDVIAARFVDKGDLVKAARVRWSKTLLKGVWDAVGDLLEARELLQQSGRDDDERQQVEWDVLFPLGMGFAKISEAIAAEVGLGLGALASNERLYINPLDKAMMVLGPMFVLFGVAGINGERSVNPETIFSAFQSLTTVGLKTILEAENASTGARKEVATIYRVAMLCDRDRH